MFFKRFSFLVAIRIFFMLTNVIVIATIFGDKRLFFNQIILVLVLIIQVAELIRFVNHTNRELTRLLLAIRYDDFAITFKKHSLGNSFKELQGSMIEIIQAYRKVKMDKEAQSHFLQMLVSQLHIGIITLEDDEVKLINPAAESLLGIQGMRNWKLIKRKNPAFMDEVENLGADGRKLIELKYNGESKFLAAGVHSRVILNKQQKLITLQDINSEIEQKEIEAWHKLIRILTHEIMNSITPISSLTETIQSFLQDKAGNQKDVADISNEVIGDIRFSLKTIQKRSDGLLNFVENYRKLTKVPQPKLESVIVSNLLYDVKQLFDIELAKRGIAFSIQSDEQFCISLDRALIEQVLVNLITNSMQALEQTSDPSISIKAYVAGNFSVIAIEDNGKGIGEKELREIFIPFFSTKKEGSGIGLSLSKQIMSLHGGSIKVQSKVDEGTTFILQFRQ